MNTFSGNVQNRFTQNIHPRLNPQTGLLRSGHAAVDSLRCSVCSADGDVAVEVGRREQKLSRRTVSQMRDLCASLGIAMTIEDSWGSDVVTAAIAHLAHSTPTELLFTATDFNSYVTVSTAEGAPQRAGGRMAASKEPGLGIRPRADVLAEPVAEYS